jgi:hypothetical protein
MTHSKEIVVRQFHFPLKWEGRKSGNPEIVNPIFNTQSVNKPTINQSKGMTVSFSRGNRKHPWSLPWLSFPLHLPFTLHLNILTIILQDETFLNNRLLDYPGNIVLYQA